VKATITNIGEAPVVNPLVNLSVSSDGGSTYHLVYSDTSTTTIRSNGVYDVLISYQAPIVEEDTLYIFHMEVNPDGDIPELDMTNNNASAGLIILDMRPDFVVTASDISIEYGPTNDTEPMFGRTITIFADIRNDGGTNPGNVSIRFGLTYGTIDYEIAVQSYAIPAGMMHPFEQSFTINITEGGVYPVYVSVDPADTYNEKNEDNNNASIDLVIEQVTIEIWFSSIDPEYNVGEDMVITLNVTYDGNEPIVNLRGVYVHLVDSSGEILAGEDVYVQTNANGYATFSFGIPTTLESDDYDVVAGVRGQDAEFRTTVTVHGTVSGAAIPWFIWIAVIVAIVGVVVGFTVYTYVRGLGKLVECGECGEFIPAASKKCPKCGVEFESGTMKCSECGAWVPAESPECPNCGVKFVGEELGESDYTEKMRVEYDEMVSKYRELAKPQLGKKFSDKAFEQWWMTQPTYISFEDWLAKEEERRKDVPVACPVCGTMNPKEATVCHKCGTVLGAVPQAQPPQQRPPPAQPPAGMPREAPPVVAEPREPAQQPPQAAAPKMVIRRPIDRKVVPKKIIRTPTGEGSENNEEQQ
jgi:ribosomal protein L40E